jgi:hypothetical protein
VLDGIELRAILAGLSRRTTTLRRIAAVGFELRSGNRVLPYSEGESGFTANDNDEPNEV